MVDINNGLRRFQEMLNSISYNAPSPSILSNAVHQSDAVIEEITTVFISSDDSNKKRLQMLAQDVRDTLITLRNPFLYHITIEWDDLVEDFDLASDPEFQNLIAAATEAIDNAKPEDFVPFDEDLFNRAENLVNGVEAE